MTSTLEDDESASTQIANENDGTSNELTSNMDNDNEEDGIYQPTENLM